MAGPGTNIGTTDYGEIQENELQALESIYMEGFEAKKGKPGAWNKIPEREFALKLRPSNTLTEDLAEDVFVILHVSLPATYPKSLPRCRLEFAPIIPDRVRSNVTQVLRKKPEELIGSEMMFELASSVQEILEDGVSIIVQSKEVPALDKERAVREAEVQLKANEDRQLQDQMQKAADEEEQRLLSEMVQQERSRIARLQAKSRSISGEAEVSQTTPTAHDQSITFDHEIKVDDPKGSGVIAFRSLVNKTKYRRGPVSTVYTTEPYLADIGSQDDCELVLALKECKLQAEKRSVQALEARLETLLKLGHHTNVMRILAFEVSKLAPSLSWMVRILTPFANAHSMRDLLNVIETVEVTKMRPWTIQILEGLHYLHQNHLVMARMTIDNVLLETSGTGIIVKLSDVNYQHELHTMCKSTEQFSSAASSYWIPPETDRSKAKSSQDIWYLGVVLLQSLFGVDVQSQHNGPSTLINNMDLSISFEDLLMSIFTADPKKRPSAFDLLPNEFLRSEDPVLETETNMSLEITPMPWNTATRSAQYGATSSSRYANDFVELGRLGKGGFGEVVKARNKLDGTTYAVKKITQPSAADLSSVLSEVMLLSRLNHPNIVRYYTAWTEDEGSLNTGPSARDDSSEDEDSFSYRTPTAQGLDFISSGGGDAGIEFGYDSDEEEETELSHMAIEDDDSVSSRSPERVTSHRRRRRSSTNAGGVTLFIQMEFCDKRTLRDLLGDTQTDVDECWRLFRQILSSLAYIHANKFLHRDLKPDNIFIALDESDKPSIKLGDFGLAKPGDTSKKPASSETTDFNLTASIGTLLYVAPEVRSTSGRGSYNDKADMYSLGIILFEMSYSFTTAMERSAMLADIRQPSFEYPAVFKEPEKHLQAEIVKCLVKHTPNERPSSHELLHSGRIPSQVEDEAIQSALRSLSDKTSPSFSKLMDGLFSQVASERDAKDVTYDLDLSMLSQSVDSVMLRSTLQDIIRSICERHGALESQRQLLIPYSDQYDSAVKLLDSSGAIVQLPYDFTVPYARSVAKQQRVIRKSFYFGNVFRRAPAGVHPFVHGEFDFDIVTEDSLDLALREAEVLKVVNEVVDAIPALSSAPIVYHLTHSTLVDAILAFCGIPQQRNVKQIISKLNIGHWTWAKIRNELKALDIGISSTSLDDFKQFDFRESCVAAIEKLRSLLGSKSDALESTFRHMEAVTTYMTRFDITRKVFVHPLGSINEHAYRGCILFQCVIDSKRKKVLCAGGRYDALIQEYRVGSKFNRHAVGFNLALDNIVDSMAQWSKPSGKQYLKRTASEDESQDATWKSRRCDVLIDSNEPALLRTIGISIVQQLWSADIKAELVVDSGIRESTSFQHQQSSRDESTVSHDWIVLVKPDDTLKVRSNIRKEDVDLRRAELLSWLRNELRERDRNESRASGRSRSYGQQSHAHEFSGVSSNSRNPNITVLAAQHRSKKTNRRMVMDDALSRTAAAGTSSLEAPITAVELKDDLFDAMRDTRLSDPESWRRFVQSAPLAERNYLNQIHEMLVQNAGDGASVAWVYNFRSKNCFLYDVSRAG